MILGLDFDGTCVTHEFPEIGRDIGSIPWLQKWIDDGHKIVLNTMRSGDFLNDAVDWFGAAGVDLYGINRNPTQDKWTSSPKVYAHVYIDDAALGTALVYTKGARPYVEWEIMGPMLLDHGKPK